MTNGLNSSRAIGFGRPHWCMRRDGPTTITGTAGVVDSLYRAGSDGNDPAYP